MTRMKSGSAATGAGGNRRSGSIISWQPARTSAGWIAVGPYRLPPPPNKLRLVLNLLLDGSLKRRPVLHLLGIVDYGRAF